MKSNAGIAFATLILLFGAGAAHAQAPESPPIDEKAMLAGLKIAAETRDRDNEARKRKLSSPEAKRERQTSRAQYADDDSTDKVKKLLADKFGESLARLSADPTDLMAGFEPVKLLNDHAMVVANGESRAVVESADLLSAIDADGEKRQVDLELVSTATHFRPANGSAKSRLPRQLSDGIETGVADVLIELPASASGSLLSRERTVVYPGVGEDLDFAASPTPGGVEIFWQVRSPRAPEQTVFKLRPAAGDSLQADGRTGAILVRRDGAVVGRVLPPSAWDAQGTAVPVSMSLDGTTVTLRFEHRDRDLAYPLLVDPIVEDNQFDTWLPQTSGSTSPNDADFLLPDRVCHPEIVANSCFGAGFYLYARAGYTQTEPNFMHFSFTVPNYLGPSFPSSSDARITSSQIRYHGMNSNASADSSTNPFRLNGVFDDVHSRFLVSQALGDGPLADGADLVTPTSGPNDDPDAPAHARNATWGIYLPDPGIRTTPINAYAGGAGVAYTDPSPPVTNTPTNVPTGWLGPNSSPANIYVSAQDSGVGVSSFNMFTEDGGSAIASVGDDCTTRWPIRCAQNLRKILRVPVGSLPEGTNALEVCSYDYLGTPAGNCPSFQVRIDKSAPAPSGFAVAYDPSDRNAAVYWNDVDKLANGTPGSGITARWARYKRSSDANWSDWTFVTDSQLDVPNVPAEDTLSVEAIAHDAARNVSPTGAVSGLSLSDPDDRAEGSVDGDGSFTAADDGSHGTEVCEAQYGAGSGYCQQVRIRLAQVRALEQRHAG